MRSSFEPLPGADRPAFVPEGGAPEPEAPVSPVEERSAEELAREHAYARGREEARGELEAGARERVGSAVAALESAAGELERALIAERDALRTAVIELALALAGRLVARELAQDCERLAPLIEEALEVLPASEPREIALSPPDAEHVRDGQGPALARLREKWGAELVADPTLAPGEARVRGDRAAVDLRVAAVVERFRAALVDRLPWTEATS